MVYGRLGHAGDEHRRGGVEDDQLQGRIRVCRVDVHRYAVLRPVRRVQSLFHVGCENALK